MDEDEATQVGVHSVVQKPWDAIVPESLVADLPVGSGAQVEPPGVNRGEKIHALIREALSPEDPGSPRKAIREQIEAVATVSMPAIMDRTTDCPLDRLKNPR